MYLYERFRDFYDKAISYEANNIWVIEEHNQEASLRKLSIEGIGMGVYYNECLCKDIELGAHWSKYMQNRNCDGICLSSIDNQPHLFLADLKSAFGDEEIFEAICQMVHSYFKMVQLLSICADNVEISNLNPHFVVACQTYKNKDHQAQVYEKMNEFTMLSSPNIKQQTMCNLLSKGKSVLHLSDLANITVRMKRKVIPIIDNSGAPLISTAIMNIPIEIQLYQTKTYGDSEIFSPLRH